MKYEYQGIILIDRKCGTIPIPNNDDTELALWRHSELTTGYAIRRIKDNKNRFGLHVEPYQKAKIIHNKTATFYLKEEIDDEEFENLTIKKLESMGIKVQPPKSKCSECEKFLGKYEEVKNIVSSGKVLQIPTLGRMLSERSSTHCLICPYHSNVDNWYRVKSFSSHLEESGKGISLFIPPYAVELELYE